MSTDRTPLERSLRPEHIAVFGATSTEGKMGYVLVRRLLEDGFGGTLSLINPRGGEAFGLPLLQPQSAKGADLAVVVTPAHTVPEIVGECGRLGVGAVIVESAGFAEVGQRDLERDLQASLVRSKLRLIGPNCLGLFSGPDSLNLTTLPGLPTGPVSVVSQSGGLSLHIARRLRALGSGLDLMMSLGNKIDVGFSEILGLLSERDTTDSVVMYLERLDEGEEFLDLLSDLSSVKPVIALVGGQTKSGRQAARSHTASVVSDWDRVAGLLVDAGAFVTEQLNLAVAASAANIRRLTGNRVFVLCDGGGHSVMLADALTRGGFELAPPSHDLASSLGASMSERQANQNPVDLAGLADSNPGIYAHVIEAVMRDGGYDVLVVGGVFGGYDELFGGDLGPSEHLAAQRILTLSQEYSTPTVIQTAFASRRSKVLDLLRAGQVPCVEWPEEVVGALLARVNGVPSAPCARVPAESGQLPSVDPQLSDQLNRVLSALTEAGIRDGIGPLVDGDSLPNRGGRWVLRADGFPHKSLADAIKIDVRGRELSSAYQELVDLCRSHGLPSRIRIAEVVDARCEFMVSMWRHPTEGNGWLFANGGTGVESKADTAVGRLPLEGEDILRVLRRTRVGCRFMEQMPDSVPPFVDFVLNVGRVFRERLPEIAELEMNPVAITSEGPVILDVLPTPIHTQLEGLR